MAELGWAGIVLPEEFGGAGLGYAELGIVLEECGRTLTATPLVSTSLLGGNAVLLGGNETQRKEILPAVAKGERILALALQEGRASLPVHDRDARRLDVERLSAHGFEDARPRRTRRGPARRGRPDGGPDG